MKITVSLVQFDVQVGQPDANYAHVAGQVAEAARRGSDLVVLPELWSSGYDLVRARDYASPTDAGAFAQMANLAREHQVFLIGSSLATLEDGIGNTAVLFNNEGEPVSQYTKVHLFGPMEEDRYLSAGSRLVIAGTPWWAMGISICYDLRFPEMFRVYALAGCKLIVVMAQWPSVRHQHWETLLRARAIENQCFFAACNRVGTSGSTRFAGGSCVLGPSGESLATGGDGPELVTAEIDFDRMKEVRNQIPVFRDRRVAVYGATPIARHPS
jgi:predicted amidohydrolase